MKKGPKTSKKPIVVPKWILYSIIILGVVLMILITFSSKKTKSEVATIYPSPTINQPIPSYTPTPTLTTKIISLDIPQENDWIKYEANCSPFKSHLEIYYPKQWIPREFPFVRSGPDPINECQVIFGYKKKPGSPDYIGADEIARISISIWQAPSNLALKDYIEDISTNYNYTVGEIVINNINYSTLTDGNHVDFVTKNANYVSKISLIQKSCFYGCSPGIFDSSKDLINNGFTQRLRIF